MQTCRAKEVGQIGIWEEAVVIIELLISQELFFASFCVYVISSIRQQCCVKMSTGVSQCGTQLGLNSAWEGEPSNCYLSLPPKLLFENYRNHQSFSPGQLIPFK